MCTRFIGLTICIIIVTTQISTGQNTWVRLFGGKGDEVGMSIIEYPDGGYIITGSTTSSDIEFSGYDTKKQDAFVMKIDNKGKPIWKSTIGGSLNEVGLKIILTKDDDILVMGRTFSSDGDFTGLKKDAFEDACDIFIGKYDKSGNRLWLKTYGGNMIDEGTSIIEHIDGTISLFGSTESRFGDFEGLYIGEFDFFFFKLNTDGDIIWKKVYGGSNHDNATSVASTTDGGYIITGNSYSHDGDFTSISEDYAYMFILKIDSNGNIFQITDFGGEYREECSDTRRTIDDGFITIGTTASPTGIFETMKGGDDDDIFILKSDKYGYRKWIKTYGGIYDDRGFAITQSEDGGYVFAGKTESYDMGFNRNEVLLSCFDIFIMKIDFQGNIKWCKYYGGESCEEVCEIINTSDGGYILTGQTSSKKGNLNLQKQDIEFQAIFLLKVNKDGEIYN